MEAGFSEFHRACLGMLERRDAGSLSPSERGLLTILRRRAANAGLYGTAAREDPRLPPKPVNPKHVDLVLEQVPSASRMEVIAALQLTNGDIVNAIILLDERPPMVKEAPASTDETDPRKIDYILERAVHASREEAVAMLREKDGDICDAILELKRQAAMVQAAPAPLVLNRLEERVLDHAYAEPLGPAPVWGVRGVTREELDRFEAQLDREQRAKVEERAMMWRSAVDEMRRFPEHTKDEEKDTERIAAALSALGPASNHGARYEKPEEKAVGPDLPLLKPERKPPSTGDLYRSLVERLKHEKAELEEEKRCLTRDLGVARSQNDYAQRYAGALTEEIRRLGLRLQEATRAGPAPIVVIYPEPWPEEPEADDSIHDAERCVVCLVRQAVCAIVDCGHIAHCVTCATHQGSRPTRCPICRVKVTRVIRLYR